MGFTYNDITSASMGVKARLTSWQVCGKLRNFTTTVPGKYGVADSGADFDYTILPPGLTLSRDFASWCSMMCRTDILWHD